MVETTSISFPHSQDSVCPQPSKCPLWNLTGEAADVRAAQLRMPMRVSSDVKTAVESRYKLWNQRPLPLHSNSERSIKSLKSNWKWNTGNWEISYKVSKKSYFLYPCQPMVTGANSTLTDSPVWGVSKKETQFNAHSSIVIQHSSQNSTAMEQFNSVTAQSWNSKAVEALWRGPSPATQLSSAPAMVCSPLLWPNIFGISAPASEKQLLVERENRLSEPQGSWLI